jgi:hypothetical protein
MFFVWAFAIFIPGTVALRNRYGYNRGRYAPRGIRELGLTMT